MTYRILVVDDELPALGEMEDMLLHESLVKEVVLYSHAEQALEWAIEHEPDIVMLDIHMPGMNGLVFAERLLDARPQIHIVFVTAYNQYAIEAFELSAVDYMLKPVKPERLQRALVRIQRRFSGSTPSHSSKLEAAVSSETNPFAAPATVPSPYIYSLGRLQIKGQVGFVKWRTVKVEELFAYLLFRGSVSVDQIITDVFPHSEPVKAKQYIHTCVYQVRRALADVSLQDHIQVTYRDRMYQLILNDIGHDKEIFESSLVDRSNIEELDARASLYQGDWCEGLDGIWMTTHREELRERYRWMMEDMIDQMQSNGDYRRALGSARKLLNQEPWSDHYALRMVELYAASGEKARARHFVQEYREQYERELEEPLSDEWHANAAKLLEDEIRAES